QELDLPFKIGNYDKNVFKKCLEELIQGDLILPKTKREAILTKKESALSNLIEINLIMMNIRRDDTKFSVRNDKHCLLNKLEDIIKNNIEINDPFQVQNIDLNCCNEKAKGLDVMECLFDFLVENR
ncbi:unnamed protein product, partial [marine sediment metagenome]